MTIDVPSWFGQNPSTIPSTLLRGFPLAGLAPFISILLLTGNATPERWVVLAGSGCKILLSDDWTFEGIEGGAVRYLGPYAAFPRPALSLRSGRGVPSMPPRLLLFAEKQRLRSEHPSFTVHSEEVFDQNGTTFVDAEGTWNETGKVNPGFAAYTRNPSQLWSFHGEFHEKAWMTATLTQGGEDENGTVTTLGKQAPLNVAWEETILSVPTNNPVFFPKEGIRFSLSEGWRPQEAPPGMLAKYQRGNAVLEAQRLDQGAFSLGHLTGVMTSVLKRELGLTVEREELGLYPPSFLLSGSYVEAGREQGYAAALIELPSCLVQLSASGPKADWEGILADFRGILETTGGEK